jgi:hypothetical protein
LGEEEGPAANIERAQFNAVGHPSSRPRPITIKLAAAVCTWKILDLAEQKDLLLRPTSPFCVFFCALLSYWSHLIEQLYEPSEIY